MIRQTLHYGDLRIAYRVAFVRDRRLAIHVHPNGEVHVDAPRDADLGDIKSAVLLRARWISVRLALIDARATHVLAREYVSGESHPYLGKSYTLKIVPRQTIEPSVRLIHGHIQVATRDPGASRRSFAVVGLVQGARPRSVSAATGAKRRAPSMAANDSALAIAGDEEAMGELLAQRCAQSQSASDQGTDSMHRLRAAA